MITLLFLIFEIRRNTIARQQQSSRASMASLQQVSCTMMNPKIAKDISAAYAEVDAELSVTQTTQLEHHCIAFLLVLQQGILDRERGIHPNVI